MNRRDFGHTVLLAASGIGAGLLCSGRLWGEGSLPLGIQLYSVRNECQRDLAGTLGRLMRMGYSEVEFYDFYGERPQEISALLNGSGLLCRSAHYQYPALRDQLEAVIDYANALGLKYLVCAWIPEELRRTRDDYLRIAERLNHAGERCRAAGLQLAYHNHNYEFRNVGRETGFDVLLRNTEAAAVSLEVDCYWLAAAGLDPAKFIDAHGRRCRLLHIKDRKPGFKPTTEMAEGSAPFAVLGRGAIDHHAVIAAALRARVEIAYIDQDACEGDALVCAEQNVEAWQKLF